MALHLHMGQTERPRVLSDPCRERARVHGSLKSSTSSRIVFRAATQRTSTARQACSQLLAGSLIPRRFMALAPRSSVPGCWRHARKSKTERSSCTALVARLAESSSSVDDKYRPRSTSFVCGVLGTSTRPRIPHRALRSESSSLALWQPADSFAALSAHRDLEHGLPSVEAPGEVQVVKRLWDAESRRSSEGLWRRRRNLLEQPIQIPTDVLNAAVPSQILREGQLPHKVLLPLHRAQPGAWLCRNLS